MIPIYQGSNQQSGRHSPGEFDARFMFDEHDERFSEVFHKLVVMLPRGACGEGILYENGTFLVRGYCWDPDDVDNFRKPNFVHKPSGFEIGWYKHPLRAASSNMDISFERFSNIIDECVKSIRGGSSMKSTKPAPTTGYVLNMEGIAALDIYKTRMWQGVPEPSLDFDKIIPLPDNETIKAMDSDDRHDNLILYREIVRGTLATPTRTVIHNDNCVAFEVQSWDRHLDRVFMALAATYCRELRVSFAGTGNWSNCGTIELSKYGEIMSSATHSAKDDCGKAIAKEVFDILGKS